MLGLFGTLAYAGLRIATRNSDPWLKLVVATSATWLVGQAAINIAYVVGLLPVTGLPLPLISSGGTSLVVTMFVFGMLANAARHEPEAHRRAAPPRPGQAGAAPAAARPPRARPTGRSSRERRSVPARTAAGRPVRDRTAAERSASDDPLVVAGGGSAGHIEPALALADAVLRLDPVRHASPPWAPNAGWTPRSSRRGATPSS